MQTTRIIRLTILADFTRQETYTFPEPISLPNTMGKIEELLKPEQKKTLRYEMKRLTSILSSTGILKVREPLHVGDVVLLPVPKKKRLADVVIHSSTTIDLLLDREGLLYQFAVGKDGIFEVTAKLIKDDQNFLHKLKANLDDVPMRDYLVQRSLAGSQVSVEQIESVSDRMGIEDAAKYLGIAKSTLYKKSSSAEIPCSKASGKLMFLKVDLDAYIEANRKKKPRQPRF
jgi:hypothetical protein